MHLILRKSIHTICAGIACLQLLSCMPPTHLDSTVSSSDQATNATSNGVEASLRIISDNDYMKECIKDYPVVYETQIEYEGIYPGVTSQDRLVEQLGQPNKSDTFGDDLEYLFFESQYVDHFFITDNLVSIISVQSDSKDWFPLKSILERYGCPDMILSSASDTDLSESTLVYDHTYFEYSVAGLSVTFDKFPVHYSDSPIVMEYSAPIPVHDYLEDISYYLDHKMTKAVNFSEAVQDAQ